MQFTFHSAATAGRLFLDLTDNRPFVICTNYADEFCIEAPACDRLPALHASGSSAVRALMRACGEDAKLCQKCGRSKPFTQFQRNAGRPDGLSVYCRKCEVERIRVYRLRKVG